MEGALFRVSRKRLESTSTVFRDMFSVPPPEGVIEVKVEDKSIVLEGYKSIDFERLLAFLEPSS